MDGFDQLGGEMSFVHDYLGSACDDVRQNDVDPATITLATVLTQLHVEWCDLVASKSLVMSGKGSHRGTTNAAACTMAYGGDVRQERRLRLLLQTWRLYQAKKREQERRTCGMAVQQARYDSRQLGDWPTRDG